MITKDLLDEYFSGWDTGDIRWKKPTAHWIKVGDRAGNIHKYGYRHVQLFNIKYRLHRLVFFYHHGYFPIEVDHINGVRDDNRIENLRAATKYQNQQNVKKHIATTSKYIGVGWHKRDKKWYAKIGINYKTKNLGFFDTEQEAYAAYCEAKAKLHTFQPTVRRNAYDGI